MTTYRNLDEAIHLFDVSTGVFLGQKNKATGRTLFDEMVAAYKAHEMAWVNMITWQAIDNGSEYQHTASNQETRSRVARTKALAPYVEERNAAYKKHFNRKPTSYEMNQDAQAIWRAAGLSYKCDQ